MSEPLPHKLYLTFSASHDQNEAIAKYIQRYQQDPQSVFVYKRMLWVGPLPDQTALSESETSVEQSKSPDEHIQLEMPF